MDDQNDASAQISLYVYLSEDERFTRRGNLQVRCYSDKFTCEFGSPTMGKRSSTSQVVFDGGHHNCDEMTEEMVREIAEQFVLDVIAGKLVH